MGVASGILKSMLRQWLRKHRFIDPHILTVHLGSAILDFTSNLLASDIVVPTWSNIQEANSSINWVSILERPENLLNQGFLDKKLATMELNPRIRVTKALNKLARKKYKGLLKER